MSRWADYTDPTCERCGTATLDRADRHSFEPLYCGQCIEVLESYNTDEENNSPT